MKKLALRGAFVLLVSVFTLFLLQGVKLLPGKVGKFDVFHASGGLLRGMVGISSSNNHIDSIIWASWHWCPDKSFDAFCVQFNSNLGGGSLLAKPDVNGVVLQDVYIRLDAESTRFFDVRAAGQVASENMYLSFIDEENSHGSLKVSLSSFSALGVDWQSVDIKINVDEGAVITLNATTEYASMLLYYLPKQGLRQEYSYTSYFPQGQKYLTLLGLHKPGSKVERTSSISELMSYL